MSQAPPQAQGNPPGHGLLPSPHSSNGWAELEHTASTSPSYWVFHLLKEVGVSRPDKAHQFGGCDSELIRVAIVSAKPPEFSRVVSSSGDCSAANKQQVPALLLRFLHSHHFNTSVKLPQHLPLVPGCKSHSIAASLVKVPCWWHTLCFKELHLQWKMYGLGTRSAFLNALLYSHLGYRYLEIY